MSKLEKVPARNIHVRKMVRHEYPYAEPKDTGDVDKRKTLANIKCLPLTVEPSAIEEIPKKNTNPTRPMTPGTAKDFISKNIKAVMEKDTKCRSKKSDESIRKIYDRKESRSKRGPIYKDELMANLLHQNHLAEERLKKERKNRRSSFFPLPCKECEDPIESKARSGDSGDGENSIMITDENKSVAPPTPPAVIKRTKITELKLMEDESQNVKGENNKTSCPEPDIQIDLLQKVLEAEESYRFIKEENHVLKKRVRKFQQLKVENFVLTENIKKLENDIKLLAKENKELKSVGLASKENSDALDHNSNQNHGLNSSLSYTIATSENRNLREINNDVRKSYSSRLLSMEQRVTDIVSILEIMKTVVVEQKLASEGSEKRFLEFMTEVNMVSLLQNLLRILTSSTTPACM